MSNKYQVSIVVCSYNPVWEKLKTTLLRAIEQKDICFEIVVCDDGSKTDYFALVKDFFEQKKFPDYKLIKNEVNVGTVKNYLSGIEEAEGEYIFGTSPGDYIYDKVTLKRLYDFAVDRQANLCFGNAAYYCPTISVSLLKGSINAPAYPKMFGDIECLRNQALHYFACGYILGATFLRERENAIKYIDFVSNFAKYAEDTSVFFQVMDNEPIYHYDEYIVWYEYGMGISTSGINPYTEQLGKDNDNAFEKLREMYPDDKILKVNRVLRSPNSRILKVMKILAISPYIFYQFLKLRSCKKRMVNEAPVDMAKFPKFDEE